MIDIAIFCSFYAVTLGFHRCMEHFTKLAASPAKVHGISGFLATVASHNMPLFEAAKEFLNHVIVYSGYVIPAHLPPH